MPCGPTTAFMDLAPEPCPQAPAGGLSVLAWADGAPMQPAREELADCVMAHLAGALAHERSRLQQGRELFRTRWGEGRDLQRRLGRACALAGLNPRAVILDDDLDELHEEPVDRQRPLPSADQVVRLVLAAYPLVGATELLAPDSRGQAEHRPALALCSLLAVLEVGDCAKGVMHVLEEQGWAAPARWIPELTTLTMSRVIEFMASAPFRRMLGRTLGARRGAQCYARMMPRLIQGLCRKLLLAHVLWLVHEQLCAPPRVAVTSLQSLGCSPSRSRAVERPTPCAYLL